MIKFVVLLLVNSFSWSAWSVAISPKDDQEYGRLVIEKMPTNFVNQIDSNKNYSHQRIDYSAVGSSHFSSIEPGREIRLKPGKYCLKLSQSSKYNPSPFPDLVFCDVEIKSAQINRYNIWTKVTLIYLKNIEHPTLIDDFGGKIHSALLNMNFAQLKKYLGESFFILPQNTEIRYSAIYPSERISLVGGQVFNLDYKGPADRGTVLNIRPASDGALPNLLQYARFIQIFGMNWEFKDKIYFRFTPSEAYNSSLTPKKPGKIEFEFFGPYSSTKYFNPNLYIFPYESIKVSLFGLPEVELARYSPMPNSIQLARIDVNHVQVTKEDGSVDTRIGAFTVECLTSGGWQFLKLLGRPDTTENFHEVSSFQTGYGLDVLPGFQYRVTVNYSLDGPKQQVFTFDLR